VILQSNQNHRYEFKSRFKNHMI